MVGAVESGVASPPIDALAPPMEALAPPMERLSVSEKLTEPCCVGDRLSGAPPAIPPLGEKRSDGKHAEPIEH